MITRPMLPLTVHSVRALTLADLRAGQQAAIVDMLRVDDALRKLIVVDGREWHPAELIYRLVSKALP